MSEEPKRTFKGVWIPVEIWDAKNLTWMEKCLAAEIDALDDGSGCWASNEYLATQFGSSASSIANQVSDLRSKGFIVDVSFNGRERRMSIHPRVKAGLTEWLKQHSPTGEGSNHPRVTPYVERLQRDTNGVTSTPMAPKGAEGSSYGTKMSGFEEFWKEYPKKKSKDDAKRAWARKGCASLIEEIMLALSLQKGWASWTKKGGQFIPYPASWLNGKQWEDEEHAEPAKPTQPTRKGF